MYKSFNSLDALFAYIQEDKHWTGANASHYNRYPVRFVLFDNFSDFNEFIVNRPTGIYKHSIDTMIDIESPDDFLSYTELSREIRAFTKKIPINDLPSIRFLRWLASMITRNARNLMLLSLLYALLKPQRMPKKSMSVYTYP